MSRILYAPRPIETRKFSGNYDKIGCIVDRAYLISKETLYHQNEPKSTYYNVCFESYSGNSPICHSQTVKVPKEQVVDTYDECEDIVKKLNENFENAVRRYRAQETLEGTEELIASYKEILNKVQQQAKDTWALYPDV